MVPEAILEDTGAGLVPRSVGWFVLNVRDGRWFDKPGQGHSLPLTGDDEYEAETFFPMLGMAIRVMNPGELPDGGVAYARFPPSRATRYHDGLLPD